MLLDSCASTNDLLREMAEKGSPHGTWVAARRQSGGRGRGARSWESPEGNVYLSVLLRSTPVDRWPWLPLAVGVGAFQGILALAPQVRERVRLKWPNDLLTRSGAKLGGVLCEGSLSQSASSYVVAGIGLNVRVAPPVPGRTVALLSELSSALSDPEIVREAVLKGILAAAERLGSEGPRPVREFFLETSIFQAGDELTWGTVGVPGDEQGRWAGLGESGEALVRDRSGALRRLLSEEVRIGAVRPAGSPGASGSLL